MGSGIPEILLDRATVYTSDRSLSPHLDESGQREERKGHKVVPNVAEFQVHGRTSSRKAAWECRCPVSYPLSDGQKCSPPQGQTKGEGM
ncbi:hypothetical protein GDO81_021719 [Engystomops pustulosus]|uniref:Uncharacterized protein n=1 Tax=Engystomops pustulosus TaxID=76066 RepID=A0AAV6YUX3_ENGPU|nr:hypothetical protein GDO81_021719 [Engystomops pustulosus]